MVLSPAMTQCFFASDLHGRTDRYHKLFAALRAGRPHAVFLGGDLLPHYARPDGPPDFIRDHLLPELDRLRTDLGRGYPRFFVILGNDDPRANEPALLEGEAAGLVSYVHMKRERFRRWVVYGYAMTPPSPFRLKDWERYDVARYVDPGSVSPEEGLRSVEVDPGDVRYGTIAADLELLAGTDDLTGAVMLFHAPPYQTALDRAALDGRSVDHVPFDVHIGSIAVRRFIEERQPLLTLHGHAHESARIVGSWQERLGRTIAVSAAHDGPELALVRFDLESPDRAVRDLL
jgi:Icc-related predicted phosphoesterase